MDEQGYTSQLLLYAHIYIYYITPGISWTYYIVLTITVMGSQYGNLKVNLKGQLDFLNAPTINQGGNLIL